MTTRPRILILSTAYLPMLGGSELAIRHITDRVGDFEFDMVTGRYSAQMPVMEQMGRVRVFRAGGRLSRLALLLPKNLMPLAMAITALRLERSHDYVLVHAYQASQAGGAAWLFKLFHPRIPFLLTIQEGKDLDRQSWLVRLFRELIIRRADRITAISNHLAAFVRRYTRTPVDVIPNGVDVAGLAPRAPYLEHPEKVILTVSRLVPKNGVANLIRAFALVADRIPSRLVIVGDGQLRAELSNLATDLQVAGKVDFIGSMPHERLPEYLHRADVFCRPSLSEGLGNAFLEAMAAQVPVVASRVGGIADFLVHQETGLVCDPSRPSDIADQLMRALTDRPLRERIVSNAAAMVRERYDWDVIARDMSRVYHQLTA